MENQLEKKIEDKIGAGAYRCSWTWESPLAISEFKAWEFREFTLGFRLSGFRVGVTV